MTALSTWIVDRNNDGYPDDISARICLDLPESVADRAFWATLLDLTAVAGVQVSALPLPLVHPTLDAQLPEGADRIVIKAREDLLAYGAETLNHSPRSLPDELANHCLTRFLTTEGALGDDDGDLVADSTRISFELPATMPADVGAALANLAARIGLESSGVTLPLVGSGGVRFIVRPDSTEPALTSTKHGWLATGKAAGLADLLNKVAAQWPHITAPETGGVSSALGWLRRTLTDEEPGQAADSELVWQLQWSARWEIDQLWTTFIDELLPQLGPSLPLKLTVLASEPLETRNQLVQRIRMELQQRGFAGIEIESICSFKSGLSWLREVVIPAIRQLPVAHVEIRYRRFPASENTLDAHTRWLQELFPANEILAAELQLPLDAVDIVEGDGEIFEATAFNVDGEPLRSWTFSPLHLTLPFVEAIPDSGTVCVTTGGFIATQGTDRIEITVPTDLERFWLFWQGEVMPRVLAEIDQRGGPRSALQPFFSRLECEVTLSEPNSRIGIREENDSAAEALHEDIYFNTLDAIEMYGERQTGERTSAPGAVIPIVRVQPGITPHATVSLRQAPQRSELPYPDLGVTGLRLLGDEFLLDITTADGDSASLERLIELAQRPAPSGPSIPAQIQIGDQPMVLRLPLPALIQPDETPATAPPMDVNLHGEDVLRWASTLAAFPEVTGWIEDRSYEGRPVIAIALTSPAPDRLRSPAKLSAMKPTCLIVARHHANEISSTNAALKLAHLCATDPTWRKLLDRLNIIILPYENPDGAALHARLAGDPAARNWKHHPARYNALGYEFSQDFFNPNTRYGESRVRPAIWRRWLPDVVVDNHGVPSHEWVQPFAGFGSPPRFRVSYWIPQALLYGIIGYVDDDRYPEHKQAAIALRDAVSAAMHDTDIGQLNEVIGASYRFWGRERDPGRFPGEFHNGMLWHITGSPANPEGRGFASRFPSTTVLSWVTEVNDETADGAHLERTARAHLLANAAMLDLMAGTAVLPRLQRLENNDGTVTYQVTRKRPLALGSDVSE